MPAHKRFHDQTSSNFQKNTKGYKEVLKLKIMIEHIEIKGYKSIKEAKIDLLPINILIGGNGSGKSNFVSYFEFLDCLYNKRLQEYVGLRGGY